MKKTPPPLQIRDSRTKAELREKLIHAQYNEGLVQAELNKLKADHIQQIESSRRQALDKIVDAGASIVESMTKAFLAYERQL